MFACSEVNDAVNDSPESRIGLRSKHARETAEKYIGATVLFALVLFLVAVSQRFRIWGVRIAAIAMALVLLGYALYEVATLPRF